MIRPLFLLALLQILSPFSVLCGQANPNVLFIIANDNKPAGLVVSSERFRYLENAGGSVELFDV